MIRHRPMLAKPGAFRRWILFAFFAAFAAVTLLAAACAGDSSETPSTLRVGLIPNQAPENLKAQYEPFQKYLEAYLGMPVKLFVATDYAGVVEAMASDRLDLAYFGGLTYVQAEQRADIYPIVTEIDRLTHTSKYHSVIIVPTNSPVQRLEDLRGKTFAFGDISSTSGSLYPRIMLDRAGIAVPDDLKDVVYTGGHDATALAVANERVDAGGLEERILVRMIEQGTIDSESIRIIARSDPIEGYPWVARSKLDPSLVGNIVNAFMEIEDPQLLELLRAEGYTRVSDEDYEFIRGEAKRLGLLK